MRFKDDNITTLLNALDTQNAEARNKLAKIVYQDMKCIAFNRLKSERRDCTYTVTALVHDAYMRLEKTNHTQWLNRKHFFGAVAETMRRILIERARYQQHKGRKESAKSIEFEDGLVIEAINARDAIDLDDALLELQRNDNVLAEIVKLKFFVGLSIDEIASVFECSARTIDRQWHVARAWLTAEMSK